MANIIESLVPGGKANAGPPLGPALGPLGVNIKAVVEEINAKTAAFNGMQVPVKVIVQADKSFTIEVGVPPTSSLVMTELGVTKASGDGTIVGNLSMEQVAKIYGMKKSDLLAYTTKAGAKEIIGSCVPMGVTVEGMSPKDAQVAIDEGKFDDVLG